MTRFTSSLATAFTTTLLILTMNITSADTVSIDTLIAGMTLEEKAGQMTQLDLMVVTRKGAEPIKLDPEKLREAVVTHKIGSFINNGVGHALTIKEWTYVLEEIQGMIRKENPRPIPLLYGIDSIHGATYVRDATLFPHQIALAATRNPELAAISARISAAETRAAGLRWTFAPVLDVGRQPLWARFPETFGEDPLLATRLGVATVQGFQGDDLGSPGSVAACLKHYIGYSHPETGKDRSPALMPDWYLREYFLPPFTAAVRAGAKTVMVNSGEVSGVPVHGSKYLLTDVLRGELGFDGVIVSDWEDVIRLHTWHKVADSPAEAVRMAVEAGLDISMVPLDYSFATLLVQLVRDGKISKKRIDESVRRILTLKQELGLFENPAVEAAAAGGFGKPEYRKAALDSAIESMTLLKNENNTLPLSDKTRVLVTGPAADSITSLHGCWSFTWQGDDPKWYPEGTRSVVDAIRSRIGDANTVFHQGVSFDGSDVDIDAAVRAASASDVILLCLGEEAYAETPGDIHDLDLPAGQLELARRLQATGKPVILVLIEGRPRIIRPIEPACPAILMAYWPGSGGAEAIARVLFGDENPSGKLPFTYPRHSNHLVTYDRKYTHSLGEISAPGETKVITSDPQFEFGHGLSYTTFEYTHLKVEPAILKKGGKALVSVTLANTGKRAGKECIELYSRDLFASLTPPLKRLRDFRKVELAAGQSTTITFELTPDQLAFVNGNSETITEPGDFELMIANLKAPLRYEN